VLCIYPEISVNTKQIYQELVRCRWEWKSIIHDKNVFHISESINDLEDITFSLHPKLNEVFSFLYSCKGAEIVRMSWSGSACFALFSDEKDLLFAYHQSKNLYPFTYMSSLFE
jgi:4-diphosphocytidyl-2-C-methyl-D-erythritol kinase